MLKFIRIGLLGLLLIPALAVAHGPSRQKVVKDIEIKAPVEKVWAIISDYCAIKDWHPGVKGCESDNGNAPDSIRTITLENGEQVKEKLINHNPEKTMYQYMLAEPNINAFPINTHGATISVIAGENGMAKVEWKGAFYRSFPGPSPPPELSDEAANKALTDFYTVGLENIKKLAE